MRRVNATAFELVRLQLKPQSAFWVFDTSTSAPAKKAHKYSTPNMRFDQVVDWISMTTESVQKRWTLLSENDVCEPKFHFYPIHGLIYLLFISNFLFFCFSVVEQCFSCPFGSCFISFEIFRFLLTCLLIHFVSLHTEQIKQSFSYFCLTDTVRVCMCLCVCLRLCLCVGVSLCYDPSTKKIKKKGRPNTFKNPSLPSHQNTLQRKHFAYKRIQTDKMQTGRRNEKLTGNQQK